MYFRLLKTLFKPSAGGKHCICFVTMGRGDQTWLLVLLELLDVNPNYADSTCRRAQCD